ncbi:hypothetical protein M0812_26207 [Anaeramoeba flamelloides]|uniref:Uncharacterized protein n=1 Tax=Anaeramoeba flamelloides TaxID=1746091 RepID=A0AAV7YF22_9EUKA|nr:hypothetical protein M0812_26207 [Anaeramoeba flamelloides]
MELENENTTDFFGLEQVRNLNLDDNFPDLDFDINLELNLQFELFTNTNSNPNNNIETDQTFKKNFLFQEVPEKCHQHSLDHFSEHGENNGDYFGILFEKVSGQEDFDQETNEELNRKELSELSEFNNLDQYQEFTELRNSSELNRLFSLMEKFEQFEPNENNDNSLSLTDQIRSSSKMILNPTEQPTITATKTTQNETQNVNEKQIQQETVTEEQQKYNQQ